ncbi:S-adenosyl-L-methionine-dependent methyltransferase [Coniochaeta sp. 2T2.1]|nr:S-adenosyl-L-methionine-dependent methyltransferase [Coniochaeta sp. 2T2.1]
MLGILPFLAMPPNFESQNYWHDRFSTETAFEWLTDSSTFLEIIEPFLDRLDRSARLLHLGCGTSDLHNHLRARGFLNVTNVDYEPLALKRGRELEQASFGDVRTTYELADATHLQLGERYDLIIDKGTADAISCGDGDSVLRMAQGVKKHLAAGGFWISMSYSSSRFDVEGLPLAADVMARIPVPKLRDTDPDIYHWCFLLRP